MAMPIDAATIFLRWRFGTKRNRIWFSRRYFRSNNACQSFGSHLNDARSEVGLKSVWILALCDVLSRSLAPASKVLRTRVCLIERLPEKVSWRTADSGRFVWRQAHLGRAKPKATKIKGYSFWDPSLCSGLQLDLRPGHFSGILQAAFLAVVGVVLSEFAL